MNVYGRVKEGRGGDGDEPPAAAALTDAAAGVASAAAAIDPGDPAPASVPPGTASAARSLSPEVLQATPVAMPVAVVQYTDLCPR